MLAVCLRPVYDAMKKRTKLLSAICVFAVILGIWAFAFGVRGIANPCNLDEESLTERQRRTVEEIKAVLDPWQPVRTALLLSDSFKGGLLIVAGAAAFRLHPSGRKLLISAFVLAIVVDALGLLWFVGTFAATFQINLHHMVATNEAITKMPQSPHEMGSIFAIVLTALVAILLLKIGLEAAAYKYLRSEAVRSLYAVAGSDEQADNRQTTEKHK